MLTEGERRCATLNTVDFDDIMDNSYAPKDSGKDIKTETTIEKVWLTVLEEVRLIFQ